MKESLEDAASVPPILSTTPLFFAPVPVKVLEHRSRMEVRARGIESLSYRRMHRGCSQMEIIYMIFFYVQNPLKVENYYYFLINPTRAASLCDDKMISQGSLDYCYHCKLVRW